MVLETNLLILSAIHKGNNTISTDGGPLLKICSHSKHHCFSTTDIIDLSDTSLLCHLHHRSYCILMSLCMCVCVCVCVSECVFLPHPSPPLFAHTLSPMMLLQLMLSRFSRVRLCATPQTAAHQVPPSLGFSRQEHWSGLPFPSPVHACTLSHFSRV